VSDEVKRWLDAGDPIRALDAALREAGARPTFDPERSIAKPCMICGTTERPRDLVVIGTWSRPIGGHKLGDAISRPMCAGCEELTRPVLPSGGED
jgi:hypothetical protein